jgi:hypothetical protein
VAPNSATPPGPSDHRFRELPQGILLGIGSAAVIVAGLIASAIPAADAAARYGVLALAVLLFTTMADVWAAAIGVAVIGFLIFDGFLVNQLGELSWHGRADTNRVVALTLAVVLGRVAAGGYRAVRRRRYPTGVTQLSGRRRVASWSRQGTPATVRARASAGRAHRWPAMNHRAGIRGR